MLLSFLDFRMRDMHFGGFHGREIIVVTDLAWGGTSNHTNRKYQKYEFHILRALDEVSCSSGMKLRPFQYTHTTVSLQTSNIPDLYFGKAGSPIKNSNCKSESIAIRRTTLN